MSLVEFICGVTGPSNLEDIEPSHGRVFCEQFLSVLKVVGCLKHIYRSVIKQVSWPIG